MSGAAERWWLKMTDRAEALQLAREVGAEIERFINYAYGEEMVLLDQEQLTKLIALARRDGDALRNIVESYLMELERPDAGYTQTPEGRTWIDKVRAALAKMEQT